MQSLTQQILESAATGRAVDRAQRAFGASYDSVGRVLRQLVDERKLMRVGRGRPRLRKHELHRKR